MEVIPNSEAQLDEMSLEPKPIQLWLADRRSVETPKEPPLSGPMIDMLHVLFQGNELWNSRIPKFSSTPVIISSRAIFPILGSLRGLSVASKMKAVGAQLQLCMIPYRKSHQEPSALVSWK
ncbi:unnamed protein product [Parascedosporium putredinis]|uniref:Uncharacterized protein n=1 Tax=Parascedosporium putredinis TaxID=1442378 RepID=A0A9P1H0Y5_9PEZI|nr:unnamed protein product [Parascedosporium putredinis]CAI7992540.1 unnamed protein product [Parascedosporium putredinis]